MKKKLLSLMLAFCLLLCCTVSISAKASEYLDGYSIDMVAKGNGNMLITASVDGVGDMTQLGVNKLHIQVSSSPNGPWTTDNILMGIDDPDEYYAYNTYQFINEFPYSGTPGKYYRVTLTAYAMLAGEGSDTGTVTSNPVLCR